MTESLELIIWGRSFSLPVVFDCYEGEIVSKEQEKSLNRFVSHQEWIEKSQQTVEEYCKDDVLDDDENTKKDNIFSYLKPECIFVKHEEKRPRVAIMCKYRYDLEHGLAVVFYSDGKIIVGIQDIIL